MVCEAAKDGGTSSSRSPSTPHTMIVRIGILLCGRRSSPPGKGYCTTRAVWLSDDVEDFDALSFTVVPSAPEELGCWAPLTVIVVIPWVSRGMPVNGWPLWVPETLLLLLLLLAGSLSPASATCVVCGSLLMPVVPGAPVPFADAVVLPVVLGVVPPATGVFAPDVVPVPPVPGVVPGCGNLAYASSHFFSVS